MLSTITLFLLCLIIRSFPRYMRPYAINFDTYFHLIQGREIRKNKFHIPENNPQAVLPHVNSYPFLYHFILALFSDKNRLVAERYTGAFFECINTALIFGFSKYLYNTGYLHYLFAPHIIALFYIFWPALTRSNYGPRTYNGSPRIMAQCFYIIHIVASAIGLINNDIFFFVISLLFGALLIFTAKFALQVLVFFSVPFICFFNYKYSYLLVLSVLLSFILYPKLAGRIIKGYIEFIHFYFKYTREYHEYLKISKIKEGIKYLKEIASFIKKTFQGKLKPGRLIHWFFQNNFFIHLLFTAQFQFVFLLSIFPFIGLPESPLLLFIWIWVLAGFSLYVLTNIKILNLLGEPERYLEYATFPSLILLFYYLSDNNFIILSIIMLYCFLFTIYNIYHFNKTNNNEEYFSYQRLFNQLNNYKEGCVWPLVNYWQALYFSKFQIVCFGSNYSEKYISGEEFKLLYENYPWPSGKFNEILNRYNVRYIVATKDMLEYYFEGIVKNKESCYDRLSLIIDGPKYCAWEIMQGHD